MVAFFYMTHRQILDLGIMPVSPVKASVCGACGKFYHSKVKKCPDCRRAHRQKIASRVKLWKDGPCVHCGYRLHHSAMQCDHVRGQKKFNIADAARRGKSMSALETELAKCNLVCANCHMLKTYAERKGLDLEPFLYAHKRHSLWSRVGPLIQRLLVGVSVRI